MQHYKDIINHAMALSNDLVTRAFLDPFPTAQELLRSPKAKVRAFGLKQLARSSHPEAGRCALISYRFASSIEERVAAEAALANLSKRSVGLADDALVAVIQKWERSDSIFMPQKHLARSASFLRTLCEGGQTSVENQLVVRDLLHYWSRRIAGPISKREILFLDELASDYHSERRHLRFMKSFETEITRARSRLHLTRLLQGVTSDVADAIRTELLADLTPGPFGVLTLKSMVPYYERRAVRDAVAETISSWLSEYGTSGPHVELLTDLKLPPPPAVNFRVFRGD